MKKLLTPLFLLFFPMLCPAQTGTASLISGAGTNRPVLLIFSGSDWCAPCIRFEKNVLSESTFQTFANENLTVIKADFPQRKKLSDEQKKHNEALAEQYNPRGQFPHIVLLNADHTVVATLTYSNQTSAAFIAEIQSNFQQQHTPSNE